jgi:hypothetical protein
MLAALGMVLKARLGNRSNLPQAVREGPPYLKVVHIQAFSQGHDVPFQTKGT